MYILLVKRENKEGILLILLIIIGKSPQWQNFNLNDLFWQSFAHFRLMKMMTIISCMEG